jgi:trehalose synthase
MTAPIARKASDGRRAASGAEQISLVPVSLERLRPVVTRSGWEALHAALNESRGALLGRTLWMVNSTAVGGGVAELLRTLLPYWLGAELDVRWAVVRAGAAFFRVTKRVHNMLHGHPGDGGELGTRERGVYERALEPSRAWLGRRVRAGDIVVLHDPQTAGLAPAMKAAGALVVCRSHVGAEQAKRARWCRARLPAILRGERRRPRLYAVGRAATRAGRDPDRGHPSLYRPCLGEESPDGRRRCAGDAERHQLG